MAKFRTWTEKKTVQKIWQGALHMVLFFNLGLKNQNPSIIDEALAFWNTYFI